jgi:hypothetical protein
MVAHVKVLAANGVLSFIMALVGLGGTSWITKEECAPSGVPGMGDICASSHAGLWGGGASTTFNGQTTEITFSCSDEMSEFNCKFGGAPVMMIVATILFVVACSAIVMLALDKTVPVLPNPTKTTGGIFVSCAILEWIALIGMATKTYSTGATGIAVVVGSLLAAATGVRLIMLSGTEASKSEPMALAENTPYQGV